MCFSVHPIDPTPRSPCERRAAQIPVERFAAKIGADNALRAGNHAARGCLDSGARSFYGSVTHPLQHPWCEPRCAALFGRFRLVDMEVIAVGHRVFPWWLGYLLVSPVRRLLQDPVKLLQPFVREGMTVLEPGSGMGFFTLTIAELVGKTGNVIAVDVQSKMLDGLSRRAQRKGLAERITTRLAAKNHLGIEDFAARVDLAVALHVVHEVPDARSFLSEIYCALKPGASLLIVEPGHVVPPQEFGRTVALAQEIGFEKQDVLIRAGRDTSALLRSSVEKSVAG